MTRLIEQETPEPVRILRLSTVQSRAGLSRSTICRRLTESGSRLRSEGRIQRRLRRGR